MSPQQQVIELVLSELPCGVWVAKAPTGEFVYANQTFAEIMGMGARADVEAGQYSEPYGIFDRAGRLYPEDRLPFVRALQEQTTVVVDDLVIHRRDGGRVNVRAFARPIRGADGKIEMVAVAFIDVTAEMRATERAVQAERLVAMGTVAASVAHEINNPLAHTIESLRLAEKELADDPQNGTLPERLARLRQLIPATLESLDRVRVITRDLQTFSRPADQQCTSVELSRPLTSALQLTAKPLKENARLVLILDESLRVRANEARLVQVFVNLLVNAMQAIPEGRPAAHEVRIVSRAEGRQALVEISDTGPGIPSRIIEHLFEPFATTKAVGDGTGLGLFVCRNLIEAMGGTIEAANRPGSGAVFRVALPLEEPAAGEATSKPSDPQAPHGRVLVIDDNIALARVMVLALRQAGHEAEAIFTGQAAIELLCSERRFDVVFCDLMMKDVSGMDVYQAVSERAPGRERELVFMTGGAFTERARQFLASAPNERLEKPFIACDEVARILSARVKAE